jgi:hypothetical protein
MMPALPLMYLSQQLYSFLWLDAFLEDSRHAALIQFAIDDGVRQRATLESSSFCFILRQVRSDEVVGEWLCPGWYLPYVEDAGDQGISSPRVRHCASLVWLASCGDWSGDGNPRVLRRAGRARLAGYFLQPRGGSPRVRWRRLSRSRVSGHEDGGGLWRRLDGWLADDLQ